MICVVCGCGIGHHQDTVMTEEGRAHEPCTGDIPDPPVGKSYGPIAYRGDMTVEEKREALDEL